MSYDLIGGAPSRSGTYMKLLEHLREAQEQAAVLSHLHQTESTRKDQLLAKGWLVISEALKLMQRKVTELAQGRMN